MANNQIHQRLRHPGKRSSPIILSILGMIASLIAMSTKTIAAEGDRYRYVLEQSESEHVCRHMERVYNEQYNLPWKRPPHALRLARDSK
jgi:hypothetical protein